jgi:hypothetical protein
MRYFSFLCILFLFGFPGISYAQENSSGKIRTANYFLHAGWDFPKSQYDILARYDVLILPMEAAAYNRDFFTYARKKHPGIIILPYIPARSINITHIDDAAGLRKQLLELVPSEWYLHTDDGTLVSAWPDTIPINATTQWNWILPYFINHIVLSTGVWDGIFYDEWDDDVQSLGSNIDLDGDGRAETPQVQAQMWQEGNVRLLKNTRAFIGSEKYIVINGSSLPAYLPYINGRLFENFPTPWHANGKWEDSMDAYLWMQGRVLSPQLFIVNGVPQTAGIESDYRRMRFTLVSALLGDGYFAFDPGFLGHGTLWWYDEYRIRLGAPLSSPWRVGTDGYQQVLPGIWRRDFEYGVVFVHATAQRTEIDVGGTYYAFLGSQDPNVNSGKPVTHLALEPEDGIILLRSPEKNDASIKSVRKSEKKKK